MYCIKCILFHVLYYLVLLYYMHCFLNIVFHVLYCMLCIKISCTLETLFYALYSVYCISCIDYMHCILCILFYAFTWRNIFLILNLGVLTHFYNMDIRMLLQNLPRINCYVEFSKDIKQVFLKINLSLYKQKTYLKPIYFLNLSILCVIWNTAQCDPASEIGPSGVSLAAGCWHKRRWPL
jgi:hypothetical protein